jgi:PAS domain S-box-containing protein
VLIVDDEQYIRAYLRELLAREGYAPSVAADGDEALEKIREIEFAAAIVDKNLPGDLSGLDVLRHLRERSPLTRVIIYTGYPSQESAIESLQQGAFDYVEKPIDGTLIIEKISRAWTSYVTELDRQELFRKYETLFEIVPGIVWFMTEDGLVKRMNKEGAAMLGYQPQELLNKPYEDLLPASAVSATAHWTFRERRTGHRGTRRQVVELRTRTGKTRLFEMSATGAYDRTVDDPHKVFWGTLGVGWDVTEQAELEEQLQQARRMEAIGRVVGAVAHDFNNMLAVILNNASFLKSDLPVGDPRLPDVDEIDRAATRAADLTKQLLAFSRKQLVRPRPVDITQVIAGVESLLRRMVSENIQFDIQSDDDLGAVKADPSRIEQVIINLIVNARDAMPGGGQLTLQARNVVLDEEFAASHLDVVPGPYVMVAVSDTGHGMSPEVRQHLFEPFFTTKERGKGTGLGLATVYGIVTQAGGHISVYSEEETGTSVKVYLPQINEAWLAREPVETADGSPGGKERVLVVEDEAMVQRLAKRILERNGYSVQVASDGAEALDLWNETRDFDLLLTDVVMPNVSGAELAQTLRARDANLPVVYMSGYVGNVTATHEILVERARFLQKPFTAGTLLGVVRELLDEEPAKEA